MTKSIKLTGRITENKSSKDDIKFVFKKLDQGMDQASIVREAIKYYRKFEEGTLLTEQFEDKIVKLLNSQEINISTANTDDEDTSHLRSTINKKLVSGDWF